MSGSETEICLLNSFKQNVKSLNLNFSVIDSRVISFLLAWLLKILQNLMKD